MIRWCVVELADFLRAEMNRFLSAISTNVDNIRYLPIQFSPQRRTQSRYYIDKRRVCRDALGCLIWRNGWAPSGHPITGS